MNKEDIARVYDIKQEPKQLSEFVYEFCEKYTTQCVTSFENFCIDEFYKLYKQLGLTKVLVINKAEFKKFLLFALPLWKERY